MDTNQMIKKLLVEAYEKEEQLVDLIEECIKEIFPEKSAYITVLFQEDLCSGINYSGCLQGLEYYKSILEREAKEKQEREAKKPK